ncbi:MAG: SBBP repeat-containing protein [candidate division WOR-3 bacterium]
MINLNLIISFLSGENVYDPSIVKEWLNSYPYLYKGFTPNKGQLATMDGKIAENVIFYSRNGNMGIFITENGLSYVIYDIEKKEASKDKDLLPHIKEKPENSILHYAKIDYELIGGQIKKENIIYQDELPGYENFYLAHCPDGILFVKSYRKVIIKDVYPGIDWIFRYDDNGNFHHEFELKNPQLISQIKLKVKYADIELADNGKSMILSTPIGKIKDGSLIGYQGDDMVDVSYRLTNNNLLTFDISNYDKNKSLLIDPYVLIWSTYYGGSGSEEGQAITTDGNGNVFVTGTTFSTDFPIQSNGSAYFQGSNAGGFDAFILKFNNNGVRQWATYYGGSGYDCYYEDCIITTDIYNNIFVTGQTRSTDLPTYNPGGNAYYQGNFAGGWSDIFILKFDSLGIRQWATYYGGSGRDNRSYITTDEQGNVFIAGVTYSTDIPTLDPQNGAYFDGNCGTDGNCNQDTTGFYADIFILKFDNSGKMLWATYYGGSDDDYVRSIAKVNSNIFIGGGTNSTDFPTQPSGGAYYQGSYADSMDAFILKFNNLGQRLWATYYGGTSYDEVMSITSDAQGNLFLTGWTNSNNFPLQNPGGGAYYQGSKAGGVDAFILKFNSSGGREWATYYGGNSADASTSIASDIQGNIFVLGYTISSNLPTFNPQDGSYFQGNIAGNNDAFILKFGNSGVRLWATYYGGSNYDGGFSIITTNYDIFLIGSTTSTDFPIQSDGNDYFQSNNAGSGDAFISKFFFSLSTSEKKPIYYYHKDYISLNLNQTSTPILVKIYSFDGKLIYSNVFKTNNIQINLKNLKSGIYILKAYSKNNKQLTYKFIKS